MPGIEGNHEKRSLRGAIVPGIERNREKWSLKGDIVPGIERNREKRSLRGAHSARNRVKSRKVVTKRTIAPYNRVY